MRSGQWKSHTLRFGLSLQNDAHDVHDNAFAIYIYVYIRADSNLSEYNFEGMRQKMLLLCCWTYKDYAKTMKLSSIMHKMSC